MPTKPKPVIDIIMPTFNQPEFTVACAYSIMRHTPADLVRVIWVDNGSEPEAREAILRGWEDTRANLLALALPENLGFVKATNIGIAASTAPYVLLLNNDTELPEHWSEKMLDVMANNPAVGALGTLSTSKKQWQGCITPEPGAHTVPQHLSLAFFCTMLRREAIVKTGYLSEEYREGLCDDDDYCKRLIQGGWECAVRTDLRVVHHHRTTFRAVYGEGGWLAYQKKNTDYFKRKWGISC